MERDMDLIRKIFAEVRARTNLDRRPVEIEGYDALIISRHVEMLISKGYLDGNCTETISDSSVHCFVRDLTMDGHDFAAVIENDTVWGKLKQSLSPKELATLPLQTVKSVGVGLLEAYLKSKVGLNGA